MGDLWFQFVADAAIAIARALTAESQRKMTVEDIIGYETMLRANPSDAELHDDVAVLYLGIGRVADAIRHFRRSAELRPASAAAHFNVATALSVAGDYEDAMAAYERALEIDPRHASAHNNLGSVLSAIGRPFTALHHFQQAVLLDPSNAQAQSNFARELAHVMLLVIPSANGKALVPSSSFRSLFFVLCTLFLPADLRAAREFERWPCRRFKARRKSLQSPFPTDRNHARRGGPMNLA